MQFSVKTAGEVAIVMLQGKLDHRTSPDVQEQMTVLFEKGEAKILVNLKDLDYVSSAGLRIFLAAARQLKPDGGEIRICSLNDIVREVFEISGFTTIFKVFANEAEALDGF